MTIPTITMPKDQAEHLAQTRHFYLVNAETAKNEYARKDWLDAAAMITGRLIAGGWVADKKGNISPLVERREYPRMRCSAGVGAEK